jgi:hypothetical protein
MLRNLDQRIRELVNEQKNLTNTVETIVSTSTAVGVLPTNFVSGCSVSYTSAASVTVATGVCRDSTDAYDIIVETTHTATITNSGANGLDTGAEAGNKWYAVYVIAAADGSRVASLLSESFTSPTIPAGYDYFRRVGAVRNDNSSDFLLFYDSGQGRERRVDFDTTITLFTSFTTATWTSKDLSAAIPTTATLGYFYYAYENVGGANTHGFFLRPEGSSSGGLTGITPGIVLTNTGGCAGHIEHIVDASSLEVKVFASNNTLWFYATGYVDQI